MRRALLLVLFALVAVTAACGDDDDGSPGADGTTLAEADPVVVQVAEEFLDRDVGGNAGDVTYSEAEAVCMGESIVDALGVERLAELGITADSAPDFDDVAFPGTREEAGAFTDAIGTCVGFDELLTRTVEAGGADAACVANTVAADDFRTLLIESLLQSDEANGLVDDFFASARECGYQLTELAEQLQTSYGGTLDEARCTADGWFDDVGAGVLTQISDRSLTDDQADGMIDVLDRCYGLVDLFARLFADDDRFTDDEARCVAETVGSESIRELLVSEFTGGEDPAEIGVAVESAGFSCTGG